MLVVEQERGSHRRCWITAVGPARSLVAPSVDERKPGRDCRKGGRAQPVTAPPWLFFIVPSGSELSSGEGRCPKRGQRLAVRVSPSISSVSFSAGV